MKYLSLSKYSFAVIGMFILFSPNILAKTTLTDILQHAFVADPTLDEAKANIAMAASQTKVSEAGHLPVVSLTGTQVLSQQHRYTSERRSGPGVAARVNLYAWGGIEAEIERDKHKQTYYQHKLTETQEVMGQDIAQLYLMALRAKETIAIYKESLQRHEKILKNLGVIASFDEGRYSEVNEALSRKNQVETTILMQERIMQSALNRLSRYSQKVLSVSDLVDPFNQVNVHQFIERYKNPEVKNNPSYLAQQAEFNSSRAAVEAAKARRLPAINLEGSASRHEREVYVNMSWDIYNPATKYAEQQSYYSQKAAEAKLREIELSVQEKSLTSETDMIRNQKLASVAKKQIALQRKVVSDNELQFEVAARSLIDLLNSYQELTRIQIDEVTARNDFRDAALAYLASQARITNWVGIENSPKSKHK
ncbi:TolC family protein [Rodentibacter pneumotropicus]|uniref:TolC family protein n=1 Tax=Rodentibacter pneumotropicus TaxID=758 RepID=UPI00232CA1A0|nr:TolC family protein [Rodentibacter pneumotropicus]MDC2826238.1 TolC family protein [Rodentibacter pneumotropicus]